MEKQILIIDDSKMMLTFLGNYLGRKYRVKTFNNALGALDWIEEGNQPDLIIVDFQMPGIDGKTFLTRARKRLHVENPIVVLSGVKKREKTIEILQAGADDFISKPFHPKELMLRIERFLKPDPVSAKQ